MLKLTLSVCSALLICIILPSSVHAQTGLRGEVVHFENGAIIVGAKVTATSASRKFETLSNGEGEYELNLEPGRYDILIEALGFKNLKRKKVTIVGKGLFTFNANMDSANIVVDSKHP